MNAPTDPMEHITRSRAAKDDCRVPREGKRPCDQRRRSSR